ncbi:exonuclease mut-7 homolog isoform X12 [Struthio camelus]|uniref:exonuclease mut-7 homolog isoform X12 n=1 Tax=Struthio camelus TaxID=8801 RepID=UPI003603D3F9
MNQESNSSDQPGGQDPLLLLKTLQLLWTKKEMKQLKEEIRRGFAGLEDPLAGLLDMLENNSDWKGKGHSLGYYITSELQLWIKEHPAVQQSGMKLKKLQARVFRILAQCPANLLDPLISIYQLHTADRNYLLGHVSHLYHKGDYKEAAILSIKLKLQPDQDVEKMCTPLLLQDKTNLVEAYVGEYPELQCKLLQILDTWCEPSFNIKDISRQYQGLSKYKPDKFNHKMLSKLVFRLLERFNVDPALCPNVINQRHLRTLNYLFYKRFVEKSMTQENWTDHVQLQKSSIDWKKSGRKVNVLSPEPSCEDRAFRQPERGLSLLVQHVLGKPLDKTEQLSNWEKRPLREEQILYAASDAYCLLEVYEKLCKDPASFGLSSNLTESLMGKPSIKPRAKKQLNKQEVSSSSGQQCKGFDEEASCSPDPISPKEFSVVCDNMLQGLGRYLRCLGVDVRILENEDDHRKAAEIARQEGRVILTSGLPYQTLQSQVGEGRCFSVNCSEKAKEQALQVLKHFNVQVTLADIFSRCQVCNCNKYLKISKERMRQLMEDSRHSTAEDDASHLTRAEEKPSQTCDAATPAHDSPQPIYNPNCQCLEDSDLTGESVMLANGTVLQVSAIPPGVLDKAELTYFYCCTCCGKVFWEGSHFGRVVSQFKDILSAMEDDHSFYDLS